MTKRDDEKEGNLIPSSSNPAVVKHILSNLVQGSREDGVPPQQEGRGDIRSPLHSREAFSDEGSRGDHASESET